MKLTNSQKKTLDTLRKLLQNGPVDVTYAVRGVNRSSVDSMVRAGVLTTDAREVENRNYPDVFVTGIVEEKVS